MDGSKAVAKSATVANEGLGANHAVPQAGEPFERANRSVLWDKKSSLGMSVIESIDQGTAVKAEYNCPSCGKAHTKARKDKVRR